MKFTLPLICLSVFFLFSTHDSKAQQRFLPVEAIEFSTEQQFVDWLAKVQFVQRDKTAIYYHKGFRFKLMPDGKLFQSKAALDHRQRTITWIAKKAGESEKLTTLLIVNSGEAHLTHKGSKPIVLPIRNR